MQHIVNTTKTRKQNQKLVLDYVRRFGPISSAAIAKGLKVKDGTIARVTAALSSMGLLKIVKLKKKNNGVGKPPIMLDINKNFALIGGVELNVVLTKVIITDFKGNILAKQFVKTSTIQDDFYRKLKALLISTVELTHMPLELLKGVGVGISGGISADGKIIMQGFLPRGLQIAELLEKELNLPVLCGNDANFAVLAEKFFTDAVKYENIICLLDRGWVGSGLYLNNRLYSGSNNLAGELVAGKREHNENKNKRLDLFPFIESYGLERQIEEIRFTEFSVTDFALREEFIKEVSRQAASGNSRAMDLIAGEVSRFAVALFRLSAIFDPDLLVITGDIASAGEEVEQMIKSRLKKMVLHSYSISPAQFSFSRLNQSGVALGAVSIVIEGLSNTELH